MHRQIGVHLLWTVILLALVLLVNCAPSGRHYYNTIRKQLDPQASQAQVDVRSNGESRRWWLGPRRQETLADIGFDEEGLTIEVIRSYLKRYKVNSPLGVGWTHNYLMHFRRLSQGRLKLFDVDGTESIFVPTGSGTFTSPGEDVRRLTTDPDGTLKLREPDKVEFQFSRHGRLMNILGHDDQRITMEYGQDGYLESIRDQKGHSLTFHYDPVTSRLISIMDEAERSVSYEHDRVGNLISVTYPNGLTTKYTYDHRNNLILVKLPPKGGLF